MKTPFSSKHSRYSILLLSALLASCTVGPDYVKPENELVPFHNQVSFSGGSKSPTSLERWWTGFDDPELERVVKRALSQNLDLSAAIARVRQARATAAGSSAELFPSVDFNASATRRHQSLEGAGGYTSNRNTSDFAVGPAASWEIDLAGGLRRGANAASAEAQAAMAYHAVTRVSVAADAADAYLQIRGYQSRLAIANDQIRTNEGLLDLVKSRLEAGAATEREVAQAEALVKQAKSFVPPLQIGLESQRNRLDVLVGAQPGEFSRKLNPDSGVASIPAIPGNQRPVDVLRRRPDVIAAERRLAASNERIGAAIAEYYPKISLLGSAGFSSLSNPEIGSSSFQAAGGGALRWRIFDFGRIDAEIETAKGANAEALAFYRQSILRAAEDVENSVNLLTQTSIHEENLAEEVQSLSRSRDLSEEAYKAGSITLTDVLDANRELLAARDGLDAKRVDKARAAVGVFRSLGGGWDQSPSKGADLAAVDR